MYTTAKTHLPSSDIRFRQVFNGYKVKKGDMYDLLYPSGQVIYTPSATESFTVSDRYGSTTVWVPMPTLPISIGSVVRTTMGTMMLTLTNDTPRVLLWVGDNGKTWSEAAVRDHLIDVIYDSGKIYTTGVIDCGTISADSLWNSDNNVATGKS